MNADGITLVITALLNTSGILALCYMVLTSRRPIAWTSNAAKFECTILPQPPIAKIRMSVYHNVFNQAAHVFICNLAYKNYLASLPRLMIKRVAIVDKKEG